MTQHNPSCGLDCVDSGQPAASAADQSAGRRDLSGDQSAECAMDAATLKALRGSIKKWERILNDGATNAGSSDCPLCKLYMPNDCVGCPVHARTGHISCIGTPYHSYVSASYSGNERRRREYAQRELDFLRSLLPEGK